MRLRRPNVAKLRERRDEAGLIAALGDKDPAIREKAANALKRVAGPDAVEPLTAALEDRSRSVRLAVVRTLANINATGPLIVALGDEDVDVRKASAKALARAGDPDAVEPLAGMLQDENPKARAAAIEALATFDDPRVVEALGGAVHDREEAVRLKVIEALAGSGDPRAAEPLEAALGDRAEPVRRAATKALARLGGAEAVEALIEALEDDETRPEAEKALARIDDPHAAEALAELEAERLREERRAREAREKAEADAERRAREAEEEIRNHDPTVGDEYEFTWIHVGTDYDTAEEWSGTVVEASPPTKLSCEVRVQVEKATGSFANLEGTVQVVDLGEFPNSTNDHPDVRKRENREYIRLTPRFRLGEYVPTYSYDEKKWT